MINVLQFICPTGMYGAEMWILALAKHLEPKRVKCQLAVTRELGAQSCQMLDRFEACGLIGHQISMRGRFDPRAVWSLVRLIRKENIDIIQTHGYKSDLLGLTAAKMTGIRTLSTPHGFENVNDRKLQTFIWLGCQSLRFFDAVAPLSEELKSDIQRVGVPDEKIRLIMNGVDLSEVGNELLKEGQNQKAAGEKWIGYVGQMAYRKNVGDLLQAFDLLHRDHRNTRLFLVGEGPTRSELQALACKMACAGNVHFLGYRLDRLNVVKNLDLFCMTSSLEGIPRCMMEAMALEVPVAAFNIPGVNKLIIEGKTGLMAPFGDIEQLKSCFERILFDYEFSREIACNGRRHIEENFGAGRMAQEYTALYQEMIQSKERE